MAVLDSFRVEGKVAFLNGAGRGIGAASALALAEAGADVAVMARTAEQVEAVAQDVRRLGRRALAITGNGNDAAEVGAAIERTVGELGGLDVVVSVVGGSMPQGFMTTTDRALSEAFDVNVVSALRTARLAVPHLVARGGGSIVFISSTMGHLVARGYVAYGAAKAALEHATRLLAADLNPKIRVNAVAPGAIDTDALAMVLTPELREAMIAGTPLRRLGRPEDIAAAVVYLASDAASYVTGQILAVDGGLTKPNLDIPIPDL